MATKSDQDKTLSTNNFIIIAALVSLLALMAAVLIGRILVNQALLNTKVIQKKSAASKQLKSNLDAIGPLTSNFQNLGPTAQIARDALPTTANFPGIVSLMENVTATSGVSLKTIDSGVNGAPAPVAGVTTPTTPVAGPQQTSFTASVNGNYGGLLAFLQNIEASARPMRVTDITLGGSANALQGAFQITSYYQPAAQLDLKMETIK